MKHKETMESILFTALVIALAATISSLAVMSMMIGVNEKVPMAAVWTTGALVFACVVFILVRKTVELKPRQKRRNSYSFWTVAGRRIARRFAEAKMKQHAKEHVQPVYLSARYYDLPLE